MTTDLLARILPGLASYPDIHPLLVHFPIAFFPAALLLTLLSLRRFPGMMPAARLVFFLAVAAFAAALVAGLYAQRAIWHGPHSLVAAHRTFMLVVGAMVAVALGLERWEQRTGTAQSRRVFALWLLLLNAALVLGADRGANVTLHLRAGDGIEAPGEFAKSWAESGAARLAPSDSSVAGDPRHGGLLYDRLKCAGCHGPERKIEAPGVPPSLDFAGSKLQTAWIRDYLLKPHRIRWSDAGIRPVVRMPDFELSPGDAADLAACLATKVDTSRFGAAAKNVRFTAADAEQGSQLIGQYSCRGCHVIGGSGADLGPSLDGVGARLRPGYVLVFLKNPREIIPGTPMPNFHFWDKEALELAAYLSTLKPPARP